MPSFRLQPVADLLPLVLVGLKTIAARFCAGGSTAYEWFGIYRTCRRCGRLSGCDLRRNTCVGDAERQSDGNLRPRAATGWAISCGDWRQAGVQTGTG